MFFKSFLIFTIFSIFYVQPSSASNISDEDDLTIDLDGSYKQYGIALHTQLPWIIAVAPESMSGLNWESRSALLSVSDFRLKYSGTYKEDKFKWDIQVHSSGFISSEPNVLSSIGGGFSTSTSIPRFLPLQYTDSDNPAILWLSEFDRIYFKFRISKLDFIIGRQPLSLGVGFIWQPADLLGTFSPMDIDKEYKPGVDAVRINISFGEFTELSIIGVAAGPTCKHISKPDSSTPNAPSIWQTPQGETCSPSDFSFDAKYSSSLARLRSTIGNWDLGILGGFVRNDLIGGLFASGTHKRFKFRTEGTFTHHRLQDSSESFRQNFIRAIAGIDYNFNTKKSFHTFLEFYFNGYGSTNTEDYLTIAQTQRVSEFNEVLNLGKFYAGLGFLWSASDKIKINGLCMSNLSDPSMHLSLGAEFSLDDNSSLLLGGFLPIGDTPSIKYVLGIPSKLEINSEFGLYPKMIYVEYKRYF